MSRSICSPTSSITSSIRGRDDDGDARTPTAAPVAADGCAGQPHPGTPGTLVYGLAGAAAQSAGHGRPRGSARPAPGRSDRAVAAEPLADPANADGPAAAALRRALV